MQRCNKTNMKWKVKKNVNVFGFSVDNKTFECHLGCKNYSTRQKQQMANHLLENHTAKELKLWHIPRDMLT